MMETLINYIDDKDTRDKKEAEFTDKERCLLHAIWQDDSYRLISLTKRKIKRAEGGLDLNDDTLNDQEMLDPGMASRLLQLAFSLDSMECAKVLVEGDTGAVVRINEMDGSGRTQLQTAAAMHSTKCIDLLLKKNARTDLRSKDGDSVLALEIALSSKRMQVDWHPKDSVEELLILLRERDLSAIRLLAVATKDVSAVAYSRAMKGHIVELAALLLVIADKITASVHIEHCSLNGKKSWTIYESILSEAMSLFEMEKRVQSNQAKYDQDLVLIYQKKRRLLLREIELMQTFRGAVDSCKKRKDLSPLIQALQIGDEPVAKSLIQARADTRETDGDGNTEFDLCLKANHFSQNLSLLGLLLQHGANVSPRNLLGLTPIHVVAEKGNYQALQMLLLHAPKCVDIASITHETPLFLAARNGHLDCTKLLLQSGADHQAINRRQRPIDLTSSQDIRFILNPANQRFLFHNRTPQDNCSHGIFCSADKELTDLHEPMYARNLQNKECPYKKAEICHYYDSPSGRGKGANCNFAHGEIELRWGSLELRAVSPYRTITEKMVMDQKVFVWGLPLSIDSDFLKEYFQTESGTVEQARVITTKAGSQSQSKGFGSVTSKMEVTFENAVKARFVTIFGKKAEIKSGVMKFFPESYQKDPDGQPLGSLPKHFPPWLLKFLRWLPFFLREAFNRGQYAEGYPLSALKADFRAKCDMELDHASVGFLKLNEFIRAFSCLCKIQMAPAGNSHMDLFPLIPGVNFMSPWSRNVGVADDARRDPPDSIVLQDQPADDAGRGPPETFMLQDDSDVEEDVHEDDDRGWFAMLQDLLTDDSDVEEVVQEEDIEGDHDGIMSSPPYYNVVVVGNPDSSTGSFIQRFQQSLNGSFLDTDGLLVVPLEGNVKLKIYEYDNPSFSHNGDIMGFIYCINLAQQPDRYPTMDGFNDWMIPIRAREESSPVVVLGWNRDDIPNYSILEYGLENLISDPLYYSTTYFPDNISMRTILTHLYDHRAR